MTQFYAEVKQNLRNENVSYRVFASFEKLCLVQNVKYSDCNHCFELCVSIVSLFMQ